MDTTLTFENLPVAVYQLNEKLERIEKMLLQSNSNTFINEVDKLLTIEEAALFLHLSKPTIYSKVSKGELPYMKRSKRLYFSKVELADYLKKGRVKTTSEIEATAEDYLKTKK